MICRPRFWVITTFVAMLVAAGVVAVSRPQSPVPVTDPARASAPRVPAVHWPTGHGAGRWDDDPWVRGLRESLALLAVARSTGDYTGADLRAAFALDVLRSHAHTTANLVASRAYDPGPVPFVVLDVEKTGNATRVTGCRATVWASVAHEVVPSIEVATSGFGEPVTWELVEQHEDSHQVVSITRSAQHEPCRLRGAPVGYFEPAPPYGQLLTQVIGPDGSVVDRQGVHDENGPPGSTTASVRTERTFATPAARRRVTSRGAG